MGSDINVDFLLSLSNRGSILALLANLSYCTFIVFHIPYVFQYTKEYLLIMYDEIINDTLSQSIKA